MKPTVWILAVAMLIMAVDAGARMPAPTKAHRPTRSQRTALAHEHRLSQAPNSIRERDSHFTPATGRSRLFHAKLTRSGNYKPTKHEAIAMQKFRAHLSQGPGSTKPEVEHMQLFQHGTRQGQRDVHVTYTAVGESASVRPPDTDTRHVHEAHVSIHSHPDDRPADWNRHWDAPSLEDRRSAAVYYGNGRKTQNFVYDVKRDRFLWVNPKKNEFRVVDQGKTRITRPKLGSKPVPPHYGRYQNGEPELTTPGNVPPAPTLRSSRSAWMK
jgi:hypothetical protein